MPGQTNETDALHVSFITAAAGVSRTRIYIGKFFMFDASIDCQHKQPISRTVDAEWAKREPIK